MDSGPQTPSSPYSPHHYSRWKIEPWDFILANNLDFMRGNVIKYLMRFDAKNGLEDLLKAKVYLDKFISAHNPDRQTQPISENSIASVWTTSTANITSEDNDILMQFAFVPEKGAGDRYIIRTDGGFFIQVDDLNECGHQFPTGLSPHFYNLYNAANAHGMAWLNLDCDADPAPCFKTFEW